MIIKPKFRGFICTTAHPDGCAKQVQNQIDYVKSRPKIDGPKKVLVIGSSTGYGLASRIVAAFGCGADTIGVFFEKPSVKNRTATAGWYNTAAFEKEARKAGLVAESINGDAFSKEIKEQTIQKIKNRLGGKVDMVVYSLAAPRRVHPETGETFHSVLKPIGKPFSNKAVDFHSGNVSEMTIEPATDEEVHDTIQVMGGEDWQMWMDALKEADVLAEGVTTIAYSYIGPELTFPIYREGTVGKAKDHLEKTAHELDAKLKDLGGRAFVSVNKALVTQSSAAIPIVPLYISILYKVMKEKGLHEDCIMQMYRLFSERLYQGGEVPVDEKGRIRIDDLEMMPEVQQAVMEQWELIDSATLEEISDIEGYRRDFFQLFGFETEGVDYDQEVDPAVNIPSIDEA
ncbi:MULTISPECIES: enoyl-ACP reductase FabV [Thermoactinomyces]|jgi:enoyl-[acyl-carrier protein] reductase / trans-2-enoyl-CoA reductase (NAD+)|uniref:Trans-2-enoyl-CoA reductase [NADH] n=1 Tax=Thermoactinomyces vulgaris TaxID=2026 RepID=A0ABS0QII2_THEVU|nr:MULTISPECIES: enoyl-ACP reductase FabV [Thermoactinomyces]KFZ40667.1 trans-2-enoyl-CoA reductase [Thermoactinomyces sp. Gus2-1]MBA4551697.1 trans-2-enoyl-CoA reductase family protein [Thermoactinomyces vulgaris]MBA4596424.1 trans-2-enoyl-CoA reductase family protein [Thermoactinomyces vulgaris]MBH8582845.1 trans-2-enoyl-CoA reductase family protein [Thermoactinomyces sp. CICC 10735]MBH8585636.1 trans-2-enoyl-CoA reductase family protein [Thermoactinomyces sp. CICC 10520]